jgi:hypothetical protein
VRIGPNTADGAIIGAGIDDDRRSRICSNHRSRELSVDDHDNAIRVDNDDGSDRRYHAGSAVRCGRI